MWSPRGLARVAGGLYLIDSRGRVCAWLRLGRPLTLAANPTPFRAGVAAHVIVALTNVPLAMIFYELFKAVSRRGAMPIAFFTLAATAIEGASLFIGSTVHPVPAPYDVYTQFVAFYAITIGYLICTSDLLPRAIGVLMIIDGITEPRLWHRRHRRSGRSEPSRAVGAAADPCGRGLAVRVAARRSRQRRTLGGARRRDA